MKIIIAGSRKYNNYDYLKTLVNKILSAVPPTEPIEIVSGHCEGVDLMGERYAKKRGHPVKIFPADWRKHGNAAGPIRNKQMAEYATHCICFWDSKSKGTQNMIECAKQAGLVLRIIRI